MSKFPLFLLLRLAWSHPLITVVIAGLILLSFAIALRLPLSGNADETFVDSEADEHLVSTLKFLVAGVVAIILTCDLVYLLIPSRPHVESPVVAVHELR